MLGPFSIIIAALLSQGTIQAPSAPPSALMSRLTRGVNVARWFCYCQPNDTARFRDYLTNQDFENFRKLGITFVRLCVAPNTIYRDGTPDATNLPFLDAAIARLENAGLAVILDLHDTHGRMNLDKPGHDNSGFVRFWSAMAQHYKDQGETATVFEIVNEPIFRDNPDAWSDLQKRTVDAIRTVDPSRTILAMATRFDGIDTLVKMPPLAQGNVIYSIHCYDPFIFTHQGATWSSDQYKVTHDLPFPSSPEGVAPIIPEIPDAYQKAVTQYGERRYDAAYLRSRLGKAAAWGAQNHVPVLLGEFGCYPPNAPVDSRERWFDAMRDALQGLGLPSCLWAYDDALGLGRTKAADGSIRLDPVTLKHFFKASF